MRAGLPVKSEHAETVDFAEWLFYMQAQGKIDLYSKIAHETYTKSWSIKRKNKTEGVKPGVPDFIVVVNGWVLFPELKRMKGGVVSPEQKEWILKLQNKQTAAIVAKGASEAIKFIETYMNEGVKTA